MEHPIWCTSCTPWMTDLDGDHSRLHRGTVGVWEVLATEMPAGLEPAVVTLKVNGLAIDELGQASRDLQLIASLCSPSR